MPVQSVRHILSIHNPIVAFVGVLFFLGQAFFCPTSQAQKQESITVKTEAGELLFKQGLEAYSGNDFVKAASFFEQAVTGLKGKDDYLDILAVAYLYLGRCAVILNNEEKAKQAFKNALALDSELNLDKSTDPPKIVAKFSKVKLEFEQEEKQKRLTQLETKMSDEVGEPAPKKAWYKKWWVWGIGVAVVGAGAAAASSGGDSGSEEPETGGIHVTWSP